MRAITLRNLPPALAAILEKEASATGKSLNKTVIALLEKATGLAENGRGRSRHHDLDELAGSWGRKQAREFDRHLQELRRIDADVWE